MTSKLAAVLGVLVLVIGASATPAAPQTAYPGQMTQARVWIQNKGDGEAVPVDLRDVNTAAPLRVQVVNADPTHPAMLPVQVRLTRPAWANVARSREPPVLGTGTASRASATTRRSADAARMPPVLRDSFARVMSASCRAIRSRRPPGAPAPNSATCSVKDVGFAWPNPTITTPCGWVRSVQAI